MLSPRWTQVAVIALLLATSSLAPLPCFAEVAPPAVVFEPTAGKTGRVEVRGLPTEAIALTRQWEARDWARGFRIAVDAENADELPAMLGRYSVVGNVIRFEPRYPLQPGVRYRAMFRLQPAADENSTLTADFEQPPAPMGEPTAVAAVYPTHNRLPENLLKFYLHFTAPMSQGEAYRRVHLRNADGTQVEMPFLEIGEELWDESGTRLTLLFDPGRIKRGLVPNEEEGLAFEAGKQYTLVVDGDWPDAAGRPLKMDFRRKIAIVEPDYRQPALARWKTNIPTAGTTKPLVLTFDEPLDHAMLHRVLVVQTAAGTPVPGRVNVDREETRWLFEPTSAWTASDYRVVVDTTLEDRAGNSLGRPFEVDVFERIEERVVPETVSLAFTVPALETP